MVPTWQPVEVVRRRTLLCEGLLGRCRQVPPSRCQGLRQTAPAAAAGPVCGPAAALCCAGQKLTVPRVQRPPAQQPPLHRPQLACLLRGARRHVGGEAVQEGVDRPWGAGQAEAVQLWGRIAVGGGSRGVGREGQGLGAGTREDYGSSSCTHPRPLFRRSSERLRHQAMHAQRRGGTAQRRHRQGHRAAWVLAQQHQQYLV